MLAATHSTPSQRAPAEDATTLELTTSTGLPGTVRLRASTSGATGFEIEYRRTWLRWALTAATAATLVTIAWGASQLSGTYVSLRCVRHRIESNSTYHLHEDTDCFLRRSAVVASAAATTASSMPAAVAIPATNPPDASTSTSTTTATTSTAATTTTERPDVSFELSNASSRKRADGYYEVWLEGPRLESTADDHLWIITASAEDAKARVQAVRSFLKQTKAERGHVQLDVEDAPPTAWLSLLALLLVLAVGAAAWLSPFEEITRASAPHARGGLVIVRSRNTFGVDLGSVAAIPISDVSCAAVDATTHDDTVPIGSLRVRRRLHRVWTLGLCLLDAQRTRVPLLLGDAARRPDALNRVARVVNRLVLEAHEAEASGISKLAAEDDGRGHADFASASASASSSSSSASAGHQTGTTTTPSSSAPTLTRCVVCLAAPVAVAMLPCRHVCACVACARALLHAPCPICRSPVHETMRIYVA